MGNETRKIGLFGGSFDPVHLGHLIIAKDALEQMELDEIRFIPAAHSPLKSRGPEASGETRLALLELALSRFPEMTHHDLELSREGPSYSVETVRHVQEQEPDSQLYWILGADQFEQLSDWYEVETLCQKCHFVVIPRPGHSVELPRVGTTSLHWQQLEPRWLSISSTEIRHRIRSNQSFLQFVDPSVGAYIESHNLYNQSKPKKHKESAYGS